VFVVHSERDATKAMAGALRQLGISDLFQCMFYRRPHARTCQRNHQQIGFQRGNCRRIRLLCLYILHLCKARAVQATGITKRLLLL
jgi:hypothetical protein